MNRNSKKGFTIVELIIVIAVIAVLAAVLIPTFSNLIQKANEAADQMLIKNLNTALKMDTTVSKHETMSQALNATKANGFDVEKIVARATDNKIVWDSVNDCFAYIEKDKSEPTYIPDTKTDSTVAEYQLWTIVNSTTLDANYSSYIAGTSVNGTVEATKGVDVGENAGIALVKYTGGADKKEVIIRTNSGETNVEINAANDTVNHYGSANEVTVLAVDKTHSYHEFGSVKTLEVTSGHVVLESGSLVYELTKAAGAQDANISFESKGTVIKNTANVEGVIQATSFDIYTLEQLCAFRDYVNAGMDFSNLPVEIKDDIDMSTIKWIPAGTLQKPFNGTIRGNGHVLTGLKPDVAAVTSENFSFTTSSVKSTGSAFGLIGIVANGSIYVENLSFASVNIDLTQGQCVGSLIGYISNESSLKDTTLKGADDVTIKNVKVLSGSIKAMKDVGGIVGKSYQTGNVLFENCSNAANIVAGEGSNIGKAGGIVAFVRNEGDYKNVTIKFTNCENSGNIDCYYERVAGIVAVVTPKTSAKNGIEAPNYTTTIEISNCKNTGNISQKYTGTDNNGYKNASAGIVYECYVGNDYLAKGSFTVKNCESAEGKAAKTITNSVSKTTGKNDSYTLIVE